MERELNIQDSVIYIDSHGEKRPALVTNVWKGMGGKPGCNVVYVSKDEGKTDPYGRQVERQTSVCHKSVNPAGANCWCWADEI
jgi:hypothetical protein